ncbi:MAG: aspartate aminotransferase family protein [Alphaproteobacteria bacterium]|nr:aspartate aminotransferase family protein [Alphaproteobacteria bacterium]
MSGDALPTLVTAIPGPRSRAWVDRLAAVECPAITARRARRAAALGVADTDPIVWESASGSIVRDVDGNELIDLTAGFGVASVGHRHPAVVAAGQAQLARLPHAMGDAFPDPRRVELLEWLADRTGLAHGILGSSGSDAVEAALKTACVATGRAGVLAFTGAYHGLSYGALAATGYKAEAFQSPFQGQLGRHVRRHPWGEPVGDLSDVGAVLVEPIQGRGGVRVPPAGWLAHLREACDRDGAALIFDEIYTGFGRTGALFAFQDAGVTPDLLCLGKGMAGGFPISVCMGRAEVMRAWGASRGEALHTQTFLGNPLGCAMALACVHVIVSEELPARAARVGAWLSERLSRFGRVRGRGLLLGLELDDSLGVSRRLLERGYIALPAGEQAEVLALTPPLTITEAQLSGFLAALEELL